MNVLRVTLHILGQNPFRILKGKNSEPCEGQNVIFFQNKEKRFSRNFFLASFDYLDSFEQTFGHETAELHFGWFFKNFVPQAQIFSEKQSLI